MGSRGLLYHSYVSQLLVQQAWHDLLHRPSNSSSSSPAPVLGSSLVSSPVTRSSPVPFTQSKQDGTLSRLVPKDGTVADMSLPHPSPVSESLRPYWLSTRGHGSMTIAKNRRENKDDRGGGGGEE